MFCCAFIMILKNNLFDVLITSAKLIAKKNEEIYNRETKYYIENVCHRFPDSHNQIPGEFQVQKQPPVVFFK